MPTGYTAKVYDGTETSFRDLAMRCARGMGALIHMRDEPMDAPIPGTIEPDPYHTEELERLGERLKKLRGLTIEEAAKEAANEHAEDVARYERKMSEMVDLKNRYDRFLDKAHSWSGAPSGIKEFVISQLEDSKRFDCTSPQRPKPLKSGEEWLTGEIEEAERDFSRHLEARESEYRRAEKRNEWLRQLRASLPSE